jgi:hypothetical protein
MRPDNFPELRRFRRVIFEDFEFATAPGSRPEPVCCTAMDWHTGRVESRWLWGERPGPLELTAGDLYVSYHVPAELCCRLVLGWPLPTNVIDLCVEYKRLRNGHGPGMGRNLVAALLSRGIDAAPFVDKADMQALAGRGGPYTEEQRSALLAYNGRDVTALKKLFPVMLPRIDLPRALFRGRYMVEVAKIEHNGIPVNGEELRTLSNNWEPLKAAVIRETDRDIGAFEGTTFKEDLWAEIVKRHRWPWPRLPSGKLSLDRHTFRRMTERFPEVEPVRFLRSLLSQFRHFELPIGADGRTRCGSYTFGTITGRNAPGAGDFIFSLPKWCRGLIQAPLDRALIYLDYAQQEYCVVGTLSGDEGILRDYRQGDVYVGLGRTLGLIPPWGTKDSHEAERKLCKAVVLACNYGMGAAGLAQKIGRTETFAADLLRRQREAYPRFSAWSDATVDYARIHRRLWTKYGWSCWFGPSTRENTLRNWRVQATAAEVLRAAVCALGAAGFQIDATVHDSVLPEVDAREAEGAAREAERIMVAASVAVLGEPLRVDRRVIGPGQRLLEKGPPTDTWNHLWRLLRELPPETLFKVNSVPNETLRTLHRDPVQNAHPVQVYS